MLKKKRTTVKRTCKSATRKKKGGWGMISAHYNMGNGKTACGKRITSNNTIGKFNQRSSVPIANTTKSKWVTSCKACRKRLGE